MSNLQELSSHKLEKLAVFCVRTPWRALFLGVVVAVASLVYAKDNLPVNGRLADTISPDLPFQKRADDMDAAFPHQAHTILLAVMGENPSQLDKAVLTLLQEVKRDPALFKEIIYPQAEPFFQQNGLLYLSEDSLSDFTDKLAEAQPALAQMAGGGTLRDLFGLFGEALERAEEGGDIPPAFGDVMARLAIALEGEGQNGDSDIWADAFPEWSTSEGGAIRVILLDPQLNFSSILPVSEQMARLREIARATQAAYPGVRVGLTGREALDHEQMENIGLSIVIASLASSLALFLLLFLGTGSLFVTLSILAALVMGFCWCLGYAALVVGEVNMISSSFMVLYMGIGVAFSIHIALRFLEERLQSATLEDAMARAVRQTGRAVVLCAITSAVGFLSFYPTEFTALSDLGLIAGGGLICALIAALTMLPALLSLLPLPEANAEKGRGLAMEMGRNLYEKIRRHCRKISVSAVLLGIAALPFALQISFDYSALSFKNPNSESVVFLKELRARGLYTDYTLSVLAKNPRQATRDASALSALPSVLRVETHEVYVPRNQEEKAAILEEAASFFPPLRATRKNTSAESYLRSAESLEKRLGKIPPDALWREGALALRRALQLFLEEDNAGERLEALSQNLTKDIPEQMKRLRRSLQAEPFRFEDLPPSVRRQVQAVDGRIRIIAYPKGDITKTEIVEQFVREVKEAAPSAIGLPLAEFEVGQITVQAFQTASLIALFVISGLLFLLFRSLRDVCLVLAPILMTAVLTLATCYAIGISLNFANILVLSLILGLGVDNGIHILSRNREMERVRAVMLSSTPLAITLSNLATLASFGSLAVSPHMGLASIGYTLTIAMVYMLATALLILPAFLAWIRVRQTGEIPA